MSLPSDHSDEPSSSPTPNSFQRRLAAFWSALKARTGRINFDGLRARASSLNFKGLKSKLAQVRLDGVKSRLSQVKINKEKTAPAFWTVASILSLVVNLVLIVIIIVMSRNLFTIKRLAGDGLVDGLYGNFVKMDNAHIVTTINVKDTILVSDTIQVQDTIPVVFSLPLKQNTEVVLVDDTPIQNATIYLNGASVPLDIILPKGTALNISLDLAVPVNQMVPVTLNVPVHLNVPVNMKVPVDIPLNQTELHDPFVGLKEVVAPYHQILSSMPSTWQDSPLCGWLTGWLCKIYFKSQ